MQEFLTGEEFKFLLSLLVGFLIGLERKVRGKIGKRCFCGHKNLPPHIGFGNPIRLDK